ncbi:MAG: class I SAM-dependent methyltransferase [Gammaproteobacteria bacterium]|nr:class I SAM-dependent methyltransferase [Gammaproteobacteria bacterium]NND53416.1 class I SAM-dependent methyltransferase [Gammaproteobacteria bacterium]
MGREIAHTMSHLGAGWLDRPEREREERTDLLLDALPLEPDSVVADIGAGSGYFSLRIAPRLDSGTVLAVDIQPEMLAIIEERAEESGIDNIDLVLAEERSPGLAPQSVDVAFMVDAYHEFEWPREVMQSLYSAMRPGGRVVLIEYRAEDLSVPIIPVHKMSAEQVKREMAAAGFSFVKSLDVLPQQHYLEFARPE